jgi:transcriptional regulator with XRE-family HTH domain
MKSLRRLRESLGSSTSDRGEFELAVQTRMLELGTAVRDARLAKHLSQAELAKSCRVHQSEISRIENGVFQQGPTTVTLCRIAEALGSRVSFAPIGTQSQELDASLTGIQFESDGYVSVVRKAVHDELAAVGLTSSPRHRLFAGKRFRAKRTGLEVELVPVLSPELSETQEADLIELAEDLGLAEHRLLEK